MEWIVYRHAFTELKLLPYIDQRHFVVSTNDLIMEVSATSALHEIINLDYRGNDADRLIYAKDALVAALRQSGSQPTVLSPAILRFDVRPSAS